MRLLYIGLCAKSESLPKYFRKHVTHYDEFLPHEAYDTGKDYDVVFMQIQNAITAGESTVNRLKWVKRHKDNGSKVISWTGDIRKETPAWMIQFAPYVTTTCFSNMRDVEFMRSKGFNSEFLQIGIDEDIFKPEGEKMTVPDVIFLANNYGNQFPLSGFRRDLINNLSRFNFGVYGNGWSQAKGNLNTSQYEEAKAYRGCKIAISASHFNVDRYTSDRLFRIIGCGAFPLVHHYTGIEKDFEVGKELITFNSIQDCVKKIEYFLHNDSEREEIAQNAYLASKRFTYDQMVKSICG